MDAGTIGSPGLWLGFSAIIAGMLALDLGVVRREAREVTAREALAWSLVWVALSVAFAGLLWGRFGPEPALAFLTGWLIEKSLAVDNVFVFLVVFASFGVPPRLQQRVLLWGILGALVMRGVFIALGAALLQQFHWIMYVFGAFLVVTGVKLLVRGDSDADPQRNPLFRLFRRLVPAVDGFRGARFTVVENGRRYATPLLLVLVAIETADLVFAVDSIPAIFAVTTDPFIVYTSNAFAILGLRAMFFLLAGVIDRFHLLKVGLALVLCFVGGKMLLLDVWPIPTLVSLTVIAGFLLGSVVASLAWPRQPVLEPVRDRAG